ncbi:MAG: family 2 glycosyl transferase [Deltaproteobacteria bacterium CG_4_10_14_3_um_filter_60_8]|nr:MAG: family 2 glycosyl transferase [Deltaproteobacteria bacterium CG_4_10_14_3_um_filter_60_8]
MKLSLIITTCNWPAALDLALRSAADQTRRPDQVIVADDGSADDTRQLLAAFARTAPFPVRHCWQENLGFRAARIRNQAVARANGDYLILMDGDIVLEKHCLQDHEDCARPGFFVQGSRALLGPARTRQLLTDRDLKISLFDADIDNRKNLLRWPLLSCLLAGPVGHLRSIRTCNFGVWRADAIAVNGFNEDFQGWGREDSEFAARLRNFGIKRRNLRFRGLAAHLHHGQSPRLELAKNDALLATTIQEGRTWCDNGLANHLTP